MNQQLYLIIILFYTLSTTTLKIPAIVTVPVADALGAPVTNPLQVAHLYHTKLYAYGPKTPHIFRIHQILYNEPVTIIKKYKNQHLISVKNSVFFDHLGKKNNLMWVASTSVTPLSEIEADFYYAIPTTTERPTGVLVNPIIDQETSTIYSAGTTCVCADSPNTIFLYNHPTRTVKTVLVPSKNFRINVTHESLEHKKKLFVTLAREWAAPTTAGYIPYVWGGCSYTQRVSGDFINIPDGYHWNTIHKEPVCGGCDCAGLVLRLAHTAGIPYICKNSATVQKLLKKITQYPDIQEGDLLWLPGHVMIISNLQDNTLVEARHYTQGYGRVHEIHVSEAFEGIKTFQDLMQAQNSTRLVQRRHCDGSLLTRVPVAFYSLVQ